jgi:hypothetical protein
VQSIPFKERRWCTVTQACEYWCKGHTYAWDVVAEARAEAARGERPKIEVVQDGSRVKLGVPSVIDHGERIAASERQTVAA